MKTPKNKLKELRGLMPGVTDAQFKGMIDMFIEYEMLSANWFVAFLVGLIFGRETVSAFYVSKTINKMLRHRRMAEELKKDQQPQFKRHA